MKSKTLEKSIWQFLDQKQTKRATQGFLLRVYYKGKKCIDLSYGKTAHFYDLASITKPMLTSTRLMMLREDKMFYENDMIKKTVPWFKSSHTLKRLLSHSSGAIWWKPYFKSVPKDLSREDKWIWLQRELRSEPSFQKNHLKDVQNVYSDVGFLLLGIALGYLENRPLLFSWKKVQEAFDLKETHFNIDNVLKHKVSSYAPTQYCNWRKKQVCGQVSDENTYALGGIAPHAGLFSSLDDTSLWILKLRDIFYGKANKPISQKTLRAFTQSKRVFALGFMKPHPANKISGCGRYFSKASFGHTGFSGTSFWFDPLKDLIVVLLSNRTYPSTENKRFVALRPLIHNKIIETLNI